ncbi:hypothetical protein TorRG33x02_246710 [Trema orientale]|uniref:Uncharacterized protein n=1 Tax=Trema orientale TaxID=63057 RepID=A0A2P5DMW1_TREOI|nr:hypothetical protein TorRG33x02_246710 [Trema orientale]
MPSPDKPLCNTLAQIVAPVNHLLPTVDHLETQQALELPTVDQSQPPVDGYQTESHPPPLESTLVDRPNHSVNLPTPENDPPTFSSSRTSSPSPPIP